ncbi:unnamed protein product [Sphenostylis stenocarpa]|uniref:Secreted protein n=1 Tax=Sphenostylis stenocarpa TaxID=92480 RepID=A0AA86TG14_9FABA|nr:unnamed protein product [Sphenostylis stenocarpa]
MSMGSRILSSLLLLSKVLAGDSSTTPQPSRHPANRLHPRPSLSPQSTLFSPFICASITGPFVLPSPCSQSRHNEPFLSGAIAGHTLLLKP